MTGGPWTRSKEGVHGPLVHVLSSTSCADVEPSPLASKSQSYSRAEKRKPR